MRQNPDTNIFACFVSYPSFAASVSEQTKDEVIRKGDMFRSYIWGEAGFDRFMKRIPYSNYGQDLKRILFQFYVLPCDYERMHISDIENYRKREKAIGISIIIENDFFQYSDAQRKCILEFSIISKIEGLKEVIEKNRLDTNFEQLVLDLKQELGRYVSLSNDETCGL